MTDLVPQPSANLPQRHIPVPSAQREQEPGAEESFELREVLRVLRRNLWIVATVCVACATISAVIAFNRKPTYRANALIRLKDQREALTGSIERQGLNQVLGRTVDPLLSQMQVMRSISVAREVVERLGLRVVSLTPEFPHSVMADVSVTSGAIDTLTIQFGDERFVLKHDEAAAEAPYGDSARIDGVRLTIKEPPPISEAKFVITSNREAVDWVRRGLNASRIENTDAVEISFISNDPSLSRDVVNTAIAVFQAINAKEAQQQSIRRRQFVEQQLLITDSALAAAQLQLSNFRRREEVFSSRDRFAAQQAGMLTLDVRREEMQADRTVFQSLLTALETDQKSSQTALQALVSAPGLNENPVVGQLFEQLLRLEAQRDSMRTGRWGSAATSPDLQRVDSLIARTETALASAARSHVAGLDARIRAMDDVRARSAQELRSLPDKEAEEMRLVQQLETHSNISEQLREEYQKARIAEAVEVGQVEVVDAAGLPLRPMGSGRTITIVLGTVLGLLLGTGGAFVREHLNSKVTRKEQLDELFGFPPLAIIPRIHQNGHKGTLPLRLPIKTGTNGHVERPLESLVTLSGVRSGGAEAYRSLRTNLLFSSSTTTMRTLMVTSANPAEGKTTTAANLAVTFAQQGKRVILVDADLRRARVHKVFGISREPGLVDVLVGHFSTEECLRLSTLERLQLLSAGTLPPNPSELLGSTRMLEVLQELQSMADLVILDAAPVLVAGDASIVATLADATIMVIRAGVTERAAAQAAVEQLQIVGARIVGGVLNDPDDKLQSYDGQYYYAYQYYGED